MHRRVERSRAIAAARAIIGQGGWCVIEACVNVPMQLWEMQLIVFGHAADLVADAVAEQVDAEPGLDLRITGCNRWTLAPDPAMGAHLCYVADTLAPAAAWAPAA
jgi:hypothetical protein